LNWAAPAGEVVVEAAGVDAAPADGVLDPQAPSATESASAATVTKRRLVMSTSDAAFLGTSRELGGSSASGSAA
jgi:hypothetical protein